MMAARLRWPDCGHAWIALMRHVLDDPRPADDDRGPVLESDAVMFEIGSFAREDPVLLRFGEPEKLALYARKFTEDSVVSPFKYSYGARLRGLQGVDQLAWVARLLAAKPYSKSGWVSLTVPGESPEAVPCLSAVSFRLRGGLLHISAIFRSQNAFTAYLNYLPLRDIQATVAENLGLPCGTMRVYVDVPHVYVADAPQVRAIVRARCPCRNKCDSMGRLRGPAD
jgi:thymidylate synthase